MSELSFKELCLQAYEEQAEREAKKAREIAQREEETRTTMLNLFLATNGVEQRAENSSIIVDGVALMMEGEGGMYQMQAAMPCRVCREYFAFHKVESAADVGKIVAQYQNYVCDKCQKEKDEEAGIRRVGKSHLHD